MKYVTMQRNHKQIFIFAMIAITLSLEARCQVYDQYLNIESEEVVVINGLELDKENNIFLLGYFKDSADFLPGLNSVVRHASSINWDPDNKIDAFLGSYDSQSKLRWVHAFPEAEQSRNVDFSIDDSANLLVSFSRLSLNPPTDYDRGPDTFFLADDVVMARYDSEGDFIWAHGISSIPTFRLFTFTALSTNPSGDFYIYGNAGSPVCGDFDPGPPVVTVTPTGAHLVAKYNADNSFGWVNTFQSKSSSLTISIEASQGDGYAMVGMFSDTLDFDFGSGTLNLIGKPSPNSSGQSNFYPDYYVGRYNKLNRIIWAKKIQLFSISSSFHPGLPWGKMITYRSFLPFQSYRPKMIFNKKDDLFLGITFKDTLDILPDQVGGEFYSPGKLDFVICKLDSSGNYLWSKQIGNTGEASIQDMYIDHDGQLLITGNFSDSLDIDPSPAVHQLYASGVTDIFFAKFDSLGNFIWGHAIGGPGENGAAAIRIDQEGTVVVAGVFEDSIDVEIDPIAATWVKSAGEYDSFVAKYRQCPEPQIISQLQDTLLCPNDSLSLFISTTEPGLSYQWYRNGNPISNATDSILLQSGLSISDSGYYHCEVSLTCTFAAAPIVRSSDTMRLDLNDITQLITQPIATVACIGDSIDFTLNAQGIALTYQWYQDSMPILGANGASLQIVSISPQDTGLYYCEVFGGCGPMLSSQAVPLNLLPSPTLTQQPTDTLTCPNEAASFNLAASGDGLNYQWYFNGQATGFNQPDLNISAATSADSGWYYCLVSGSCDPAVRSDSVRLDLRAAPAVQSSPQSLLRMRGDTARFSISATGDGLSYQWYQDNNALTDDARITGSQSTMLEIRNLVFADSGSYHCEVGGACLPTANSNTAQLQIGGVGIDDEIASLLKVYPNPSSGIFTVEGPARPIGLRVFDARGVLVRSDVCNTTLQLDLSAQPKGTYLLVADDGSRIVLIRR